MNLQKNLPNKLSDLLVMAVLDARKIARTPGYKLDMDMWHKPKRFEVDQSMDHCLVCMAGAVMACELGADRDTDCWPEDFTGNHDKLSAINQMRLGQFGLAYWVMESVDAVPGAVTALETAKHLVQERCDPKYGRAPWSVYIRAARILKRVGL